MTSVVRLGPNAGTYTYAITCAPGTLSSTNYNFVTGDKGTFTIEKATLNVDADNNSIAFRGEVYQLQPIIDALADVRVRAKVEAQRP